MAIKLAVINQKGGVGKTTTAVSLAACLAELKYRVLLVDSDPQANATSGLGFDKQQVETGLYEVLLEGVPPGEALLKFGRNKRLALLPSTLDLAGAEVKLAGELAREHRLKEAFAKLEDDFDIIITDTPPSLGLLTVNSLVASDLLLVPIQCEYYALEGVGQLLVTYELVRERLNPKLALLGVLLTMFDQRTRLSTEVGDQVRDHFGEEVFHVVIPRNVRLGEAPSYGEPIIYYDPECPGATAYWRFAREVVARLKARTRAEEQHG
jgi:chromosome partitioning protein